MQYIYIYIVCVYVYMYMYVYVYVYMYMYLYVAPISVMDIMCIKWMCLFMQQILEIA